MKKIKTHKVIMIICFISSFALAFSAGIYWIITGNDTPPIWVEKWLLSNILILLLSTVMALIEDRKTIFKWIKN